MYTRQEASRIKQQFWTTYGQYMRPVVAAGYEKVNWVNYKTGIPHIYFRLDAGTDGASIAIELTHNDSVERSRYYERLLQLRAVLHDCSANEWLWMPDDTDEFGRVVSRVMQQLHGVNVMNTDHWPQIISFLKHHMVALDAFWDMVKDGFSDIE